MLIVVDRVDWSFDLEGIAHLELEHSPPAHLSISDSWEYSFNTLASFPQRSKLLITDTVLGSCKRSQSTQHSRICITFIQADWTHSVVDVIVLP